jgi:hypothetical protein
LCLLALSVSHTVVEDFQHTVLAAQQLTAAQQEAFAAVDEVYSSCR